MARHGRHGKQMAIDSYKYGDPSRLVKFEAERNHCRFCRYEMVALIDNKSHRYCEKGKKHGNGCNQYQR